MCVRERGREREKERERKRKEVSEKRMRISVRPSEASRWIYKKINYKENDSSGFFCASGVERKGRARVQPFARSLPFPFLLRATI